MEISKLNPSNANFQGYLCQVRQVGQVTPVGTFQPVDATKSQSIGCARESVSCCQAYNVKLSLFNMISIFVRRHVGC